MLLKSQRVECEGEVIRGDDRLRIIGPEQPAFCFKDLLVELLRSGELAVVFETRGQRCARFKCDSAIVAECCDGGLQCFLGKSPRVARASSLHGFRQVDEYANRL